jgi:polysaccharide pyruvyl transferase WcaK-like protein
VSSTENADAGGYKFGDAPTGAHRAPGPRIALLTPYNGGNLGDAAIQDALTHNLQVRLPGCQFSGITLNGGNFTQRHGARSFPICARDLEFYAMSQSGSASHQQRAGSAAWDVAGSASIRSRLKQVPALRFLYQMATGVGREVRHCIQGYRFLRQHDLLIVSGGGQLDDEWSGAWGHPFALFKWTALARMARVPCAFASVGAGKVRSAATRWLLARALRMARYRSYRDMQSRRIASTLLPRANSDPVVPDLAFTLPCLNLPGPAELPVEAQGRIIVAIGLIAYAKPQAWPTQNPALYDRYLGEMAAVVTGLLARDYFLIFVCSSLGDDESVLPELLGRLSEPAAGRVEEQTWVAPISSWQDFAATVQSAQLLVASRLHSAILGFVNCVPTVCISFDPKVDWLMADLEQSDSLMQISEFSAADVFGALERLERSCDQALERVAAYRRRIFPGCEAQFDHLSELASPGNRGSDQRAP